MDKRQSARVNMFNAVNSICKDYEDVTSTNPAFTNSVTRFRTKLTALVTPATEGVAKIQGVTDDKGEDKLALAGSTFTIACILCAFAEAKGDRTLEVKTSYGLAVLERMKDADLPLVCNLIVGLAEANLADMVGYTLTQTMIDALKADCKTFKEATSNPRTTITKKKTQREITDDAIRDISVILRKEMNKLAQTFRNKEPQFYSDYKNAGKIINTGVRKKKPVQATITMADSTVVQPTAADDAQVMKVA